MPDVYAVAVGRIPGKYPTWVLCEAQVKGYTDARHKKFRTEAEADSFILQFGAPSAIPSAPLVAAPAAAATVTVVPVAIAPNATVAKRARSATPPTS